MLGVGCKYPLVCLKEEDVHSTLRVFSGNFFDQFQVEVEDFNRLVVKERDKLMEEVVFLFDNDVGRGLLYCL